MDDNRGGRAEEMEGGERLRVLPAVDGELDDGRSAAQRGEGSGRKEGKHVMQKRNGVQGKRGNRGNRGNCRGCRDCRDFGKSGNSGNRRNRRGFGKSRNSGNRGNRGK